VALYQFKVKKGDILSRVLYDLGIGSANSPFRLYGQAGWVEIHRQINPGLIIREQVQDDTTLTLVIPQVLVKQIPTELQMRLNPISIEPPAPLSNGEEPQLQFQIVWLKILPHVDAALERLNQKLPNSPFRYFPTTAWLEYSRKLNGITDKEYRSPEKRPFIIATIVTEPQTKIPAEELVQREAKLRQLQQEAEEREREEAKRQKVLAKPDESKIDELLALPQEDIENLPPEVLSKKLEETDVSQLKSEQIEKIPEDVKEEKAWDTSIWDARKPGMDAFFESIANQTAAGYFGVRYGISLSSKDSPLMHQFRILGLLLEMRGGYLAGLRLIHDQIPEVKVNKDGTDQSFLLSRTLLGWAFEIPSPGLVDKFHVTPRLGRYSSDARVSVIQSVTPLIFSVQEAHINGATSLGLELDAELAKFFYILRGWASQDFTGFADDSQEARSTRYGLDLFLKGGGIGGNASLSYLAFLAREDIYLKNKSQQGPTQAVKIIGMTFAGLGLSLSW